LQTCSGRKARLQDSKLTGLSAPIASFFAAIGASFGVLIMRIKKPLMVCALFSFTVVLVIPGYSIAENFRGVESELLSDQSSEKKETPVQKCRNLARNGAPYAKVAACFEAIKMEKLPQPQKYNTEINYVYRVAGKGKPQSFSNDSVLCSGDSYKLIFELTKDSYVYIFQIDSANKIFRLFPTVDFKNAAKANKNPVRKGVKYFVPAEDKSFKLDQQVGKETIYFVVTQNPDVKLESQYQTMLAQQNTSDIKERDVARQQWDSAMKTKGVEFELEPDVTQSPEPVVWNEQGQQFSIMPQYLKNMCEGCVYIVNFEHRNCQRKFPTREP
jgi:hypothetical protein